MDLQSKYARVRNYFACGSVALLIGLTTVFAQTPPLPPAVQKGVAWLAAQVQSDGSLANESGSIAVPLQGREESLITLARLASVPGALATSVSTATTGNVEYLSRQILAAGSQHQSANDDVVTLLALQNGDGGWGLSAGYQSDALDTALALQALQSVGTLSSTAISNGLNFIAQAKQSDGGWGINGQSSVYVTANALLAVNAWSTTNADTAGVMPAATTWLVAARGSNADYGNAFDNAYGVLSLATQSGQSTVLQALSSALTANQMGDGSWGDDPYVTALALRALWFASQPSSSPTAGDVKGIVTDQTTAQPLAGVAIRLAENAGISGTSASDGSFRLSAIPAGTYTLQLSKSGYQSRTATLQIAAGQTLDAGTIALAPIATTATLSGVVKDNNAKALQNVIIAVGSKSTLTDATGNYLLAGLPPGAATISASLTGYQTANAGVTFVAGGNYVFSPTLYPNNVPPPATTLQGLIVDAGTKAPIVGASVVMGSTTQTSDATGKFVFGSVTAGAFTLTVSATGYQSVVVNGSAVAGLNDIGTVALQAAPSKSTLQGRVLDNQNNTIGGATVQVDGGPSATADPTGAYQLAGLVGTQFTIHVSATGYLAQAFTLNITAPGTYTQDFHLVAQQTSAVTLGALTVAPQTAGANTMISVSSTLVNGGTTQFDGVLLLEVYDSAKNLLGSAPLTDSNGFSIGAITLPAGGNLGIVGHWNTAQFAPDAYQFELRLVQPGSVSRGTPLGTLISNQFGAVTITPTTHFAGTVAGDPPLLQAGINQPVHLTAALKNDGNQTLSAQPLTLTVADSKTGAVAFTATANLAALAVNNLVTLDFGNWMPAAGGNFQLRVVAADPSLGALTGTEYVGNVAQAAFTVNPNTVVAGTRTVHGNIHVTGVNPAQATITDPLAPLIRTAIQKAVTYNDTAAHTWIDTNRCSSCHIGNQALIGGELTRSLTTFNAFDRSVILNNISMNQAPDGGIWEGYSTYGVYGHRLGTLSLWGLLADHNLQEFSTVIKRAADWVVGFQWSNGEWSSDWNGAWFDNDISMSMINLSNLRHAHDFFKSNAITSVPTYTSQPLLANQPVSSRAFMIVSSTGNLYYTDASGGSVNLIKPDGTQLMRWTGFSDPRCSVERKDGQVWLSTGNGTYRLNADGTSTRLAAGNFNSLEVGPDGKVWGVAYPDNTIYQLDANANASAWLSNGPFSSLVFVNPDADGSLYATDRYSGKIYHVLPDKSVSVVTEIMQGTSPPASIQLMRDGDHWLLSTTNGIYRLSSNWEAQRLTWSGEVDQMAHLADGTVVYVGYGQAGIKKLVPQSEDVAPSLAKYEAAIDLGTKWLQGQTIGSNDNLHIAQQLWGLGEAYRFYQNSNVVRAAAIQASMAGLATQLRTNQNADGGWGRYTGWGSDALVTAQVGLALDYTNPSASDPVVRKAVAWLLTQQQADGSWYSANGIMGTHESTTTMVAIWLPTILDRLGSIDALVSATFPPNSSPAHYVPAPTSSTTDSAGNVVNTWALTGVTNEGRDLNFDLTMPNLQPGEVRPAAGDAHMTFNNSVNGQVVNVPIAIPTVTAIPPVSLSVMTDKPAYVANATAQVTTTLVDVDTVPVSGTLVVKVYDAAGNFVGNVTQRDVTIPAKGSLPVTDPFAIGTIPPATYTVKAVLTNNGVTLASGQTTFNVLSDSAMASATSTLHTDKQVYNPSDQVLISSRVLSLSANTPLSNLALNVAVYNTSGVQQFTHGYAIAQLLPGATLDFSVPQVLSNAAPGVYTVKQDLLDSQSNLFNHVETTYTVSSTADTGFGLVGTIAATPKTLPVGATLTLNATATNKGNVDLTGIPLTITIVEPVSGQIMQQFSQTSNLAMGVNVPFTTPWVTKGQPQTTYSAVLSASIGSGASMKTITLAIDTFTLTLELKADITLKAGAPGLSALALIDPTTSSGEIARVTNALSALGYSTVFVNAASDFATGVRSGTYQLYLLLAPQVTPDATTQRLLREAVHRGEGLISANGAAALPDALAQISGLKPSSSLPVINAQALDVLATAPGGAAHTGFSPLLPGRIVVATAAQPQAIFTGRLPATPDQGTLSDEVASLGRIDIGYFGTDATLSLASVGRIHNADGSDHYTVWRIRNTSDTSHNVTLASVSSGYTLAVTISPHTDTFITSPIVAGTADHRLSENGTTLQSVSAITTVFTDARIVDVGDNPGAIALWANAINTTDVFDWTGAQHVVHGAVHSNSDIRLAGAQNLIDGPLHYVTSFSNSGSQNSFTFTPRQVTPQPLPTLLKLDDYKPNGPVATAAGAQYFDQTAECTSKNTWHRTPKDMPLTAGVYYIPCDVQINGDAPGGNVTLVSTGLIQIDGAKGSFTPFYQGLQFATSQGGNAIKLSGSNTQVGGLVFAPLGTVTASGDAMTFQCSVIADQIRFAGAKTTIDARSCPYATVQRQTPAVLLNTFGSGIVAYSAFDWQGAIGQYEATPGVLSTLFGKITGVVAPTQNPLRAGTIVPLTTTVQSLNDPFQGALKLAVNDDSIFNPLSATWPLDFATQNPVTANSTLRLGSGTSTLITATVSAKTPIIIDPLKQATLTLTHLSGESVNDLVTAFNAITNRDAGLNAALTALQAAQTAQTANDRETTIQRLLDAAEACGQSTNSQADALRTRVDWVVWADTH